MEDLDDLYGLKEAFAESENGWPTVISPLTREVETPKGKIFVREDLRYYNPAHPELSKAEVIEKATASAKDWEYYWKKHGRSAAFVFKEGDRLPGSLLTVIGPGYMNRYGRMTYRFIRCQCDCGSQIDIPYQHAYQYPAKYSCGCKVRRQPNQKDYAGKEFKSKLRSIIVLWFDDSPYGGWVYVCSDCSETFTLPRGGGGTVAQRLEAIVRQPCPRCVEATK